jgi:hypothetical protein
MTYISALLLLSVKATYHPIEKVFRSIFFEFSCACSYILSEIIIYLLTLLFDLNFNNTRSHTRHAQKTYVLRESIRSSPVVVYYSPYHCPVALGLSQALPFFPPPGQHSSHPCVSTTLRTKSRCAHYTNTPLRNISKHH